MPIWSRKIEKELDSAKKRIKELETDARSRMEFLTENGNLARTQQSLNFMEQLCNTLDPQSIGVTKEAGWKIVQEIKESIRLAQRCSAQMQLAFEFPGEEQITKEDLETRILGIINDAEKKRQAQG